MAFDAVSRGDLETTANEKGSRGAEAASAATVAEAKGGNAPPIVTGTIAFTSDEDATFVVTEEELLSIFTDPDGLSRVSATSPCPTRTASISWMS